MKFDWQMSEAQQPSSFTVWICSFLQYYNKAVSDIWQSCLVWLDMELAAGGGFKNIKNKIDVTPENQRGSQLLIVPLDNQGQQTNS